jgi:hypothetical protein
VIAEYDKQLSLDEFFPEFATIENWVYLYSEVVMQLTIEQLNQLLELVAWLMEYTPPPEKEEDKRSWVSIVIDIFVISVAVVFSVATIFFTAGASTPALIAAWTTLIATGVGAGIGLYYGGADGALRGGAVGAGIGSGLGGIAYGGAAAGIAAAIGGGLNAGMAVHSGEDWKGILIAGLQGAAFGANVMNASTFVRFMTLAGAAGGAYMDGSVAGAFAGAQLGYGIGGIAGMGITSLGKTLGFDMSPGTTIFNNDARSLDRLAQELERNKEFSNNLQNNIDAYINGGGDAAAPVVQDAYDLSEAATHSNNRVNEIDELFKNGSLSSSERAALVQESFRLAEEQRKLAEAAEAAIGGEILNGVVNDSLSFSQRLAAMFLNPETIQMLSNIAGIVNALDAQTKMVSVPQAEFRFSSGAKIVRLEIDRLLNKHGLAGSSLKCTAKEMAGEALWKSIKFFNEFLGSKANLGFMDGVLTDRHLNDSFNNAAAAVNGILLPMFTTIQNMTVSQFMRQTSLSDEIKRFVARINSLPR